MRPDIAVLRSAIGPMLTEHGTIERQDGTTIDAYGDEVPNMVTAFDGPVLVRPEGGVQYVATGGVDRPVRALDVTFPAEADVRIGDVLTLTVCPFDPTLIGTPIRITDVRHDAWQVARFCTGKLDGTA